MKNIPVIIDYDDLKCPWCKKTGITAVGKPEWTDNKGEGGNGVGMWLQVFTHPPCQSNTFTRWTYIVSRESIPGDKN